MNRPLLSCLAALAALGCSVISGPLFSTPVPTASPIPKSLHFENDMAAFDYPEGLVVFDAGDPAFIPHPDRLHLGGQLVAGLADPEETWNNGSMYRTLGIFRQPIPPGSSLQDIMEAAYSPVQRKTGYLDATGPVELAGLPAHQQTYSYFDSATQAPYEIRDIWTEKDAMVFRVSAWTPPHNPENFAAFKSLADKIINSLVIKDDQPPIAETATPEPTPSPTPFPDSMLLHYEDDTVAFDYLKGLTLYSRNDPAFVCYPEMDLGGELVAGLGDPGFLETSGYFRSISLTRQPIPPGSNLEAVMLDAYRKNAKFIQVPGVLTANGPVTVSGLGGVQKTYRVFIGEPAHEFRDIWLQKGDEIFILSIWTIYTNPEDFAAFQSSADVLVNSLRIK